MTDIMNQTYDVDVTQLLADVAAENDAHERERAVDLDLGAVEQAARRMGIKDALLIAPAGSYTVEGDNLIHMPCGTYTLERASMEGGRLVNSAQPQVVRKPVWAWPRKPDTWTWWSTYVRDLADHLGDYLMADPIRYCCHIAVLSAARCFAAPMRLAGAFPFFRPKWVGRLERETAGGWQFEREVMKGRGACFFTLAQGGLVYTATKDWSRPGRGGTWDWDETHGIIRFTPDRKLYVESKVLTPWGRADQEKKLVLPNKVQVEAAGKRLAQVWGHG